MICFERWRSEGDSNSHYSLPRNVPKAPPPSVPKREAQQEFLIAAHGIANGARQFSKIADSAVDIDDLRSSKRRAAGRFDEPPHTRIANH